MKYQIATRLPSGGGASVTVASILGAAHPIGCLGQPDQVAELVIGLALARASFVMGAHDPVDGGDLAR